MATERGKMEFGKTTTTPHFVLCSFSFLYACVVVVERVDMNFVNKLLVLDDCMSWAGQTEIRLRSVESTMNVNCGDHAMM